MDHSMKNAMDPIKLLKTTLAERSRKNPQFSIRAFARSSGISHTVLSLALSGKRPLSKKAAAKLADYLNLNSSERMALLKSYSGVDEQFETLPLDTFEVISDWYHYGILSALELPSAKFEARWLAKQLGISVVHAKLAMERLERVGLVKEEGGEWKLCSAPLKIDNKVSTAATKKFHKQLLSRAAESIDKDPIEDRDFSSMTFAMDPSLVEYARKRIQSFRRELTAELERKSTPGAVFNLTIQMYPVTPISKEKK
jgi:transcriptional regulator with XRE-family HTH domain